MTLCSHSKAQSQPLSMKNLKNFEYITIKQHSTESLDSKSTSSNKKPD